LRRNRLWDNQEAKMLTPAQVSLYRENGYLAGIRVADEDQAAEYRRRFDALEAVEGREKTRIGLLDRHFDQPFIWELATNPTILDSVAALIGPTFCCSPRTFSASTGGTRSGSPGTRT
jgi:hypothetical protein